MHLCVDNNNNGHLSSAYPTAESAEQAQSNTHKVHQDGKCYPPQKDKDIDKGF